MSEPHPRKHIAFGGLASASAIGLLLVVSGAIPSALRAAVVIAVLLGWLAFSLSFIARRFRMLGIVSVGLLCSVAALWFWIKYQDDIPKRRLVAEIKQLGEVSVITTGMGSYWTGDIRYLYFDSDINETQVLKVLRHPGLEKLDRVVFKRTPITDETLARLSEMPTLQDIYIEEADVTDSGVDHLVEALPHCRIEIR